ncbi:MAG: 3-phosphoshikimate 1-carboxyvinyltransferase [Acidimicrobiales bacterium]
MPAGPTRGRLAAPGSKSHTNRALVLAGLAKGASCLEHPLVADDVGHMVSGLTALGARVEVTQEGFEVHGSGGQFTGSEVTIDAGLSGTTLRFLTAAATLAEGPVTITGRSPLLRRSVRPLLEALAVLGCRVAGGEGAPLVISPGRPRGGRVTVDASASSQLVTAILLVGPFCERDLVVAAEGLGAAGYVSMTVDALRRFGALVESEPNAVIVRAGSGCLGRTEMIAGDASAAAHLFGLAAATGGQLTVTNLALAHSQPDWSILGLLEEMGGAVTVGNAGDAVTVAAPERLEPLVADLSASPDLLPTLAVLAALAPGTTTLTGLSVARHHETDRIAAVAAELDRLGVPTSTGPDRITIQGGQPQGPALIQTYDDHRMAMAFAALAARVPGITIDDPGCVSKTYPNFWTAALGAGLRVRSTD